jgi:hypothetical protein
MSNKFTEVAQEIGCCPIYIDFERLPVTFSQIALLAGLTITEPSRQTGPNYDSHINEEYDLCVESGPEGTIITFNNLRDKGTAEIVFDSPIYRTNSRHIINSQISFSPGDYRPPANNRHATLSLGDMGLLLSSTDDDEMHEKYGVMAMRRRQWGYNNRGNHSSLGFRRRATGGIEIQYQWSKNSHVHGWQDRYNETTTIPFFGIDSANRIKPVFEATMPWNDFKKMLNKAGRAKDSGGALYWAYTPETNKFYTLGLHEDGNISKEGRNCSASVWIDSSIQERVSGTLPYRPWGEAVVNRYKDADRAGVGVDDLGRQYVCIYYSWGHIRYNYVTFSHALIGPNSELPDSGSRTTRQETEPPYFSNFNLTFEYSPYDDDEDQFLNKWYNVFLTTQEAKVSRPKVPKRGEILQWWTVFCQYADEITDQDEILARKILS